ncbi:hypothetical protein J6590_021273, partial [Homalodisca vitripennis]
MLKACRKKILPRTGDRSLRQRIPLTTQHCIWGSIRLKALWKKILSRTGDRSLRQRIPLTTQHCMWGSIMLKASWKKILPRTGDRSHSQHSMYGSAWTSACRLKFTPCIISGKYTVSRREEICVLRLGCSHVSMNSKTVLTAGLL